jgi:hypothetical protein
MNPGTLSKWGDTVVSKVRQGINSNVLAPRFTSTFSYLNLSSGHNHGDFQLTFCFLFFLFFKLRCSISVLDAFWQLQYFNLMQMFLVSFSIALYRMKRTIPMGTTRARRSPLPHLSRGHVCMKFLRGPDALSAKPLRMFSFFSIIGTTFHWRCTAEALPLLIL